MTRDILDDQNNVIGQLTLPDETSEVEWEEKLRTYKDCYDLTWAKVKEIRYQLLRDTEWIRTRHLDEQSLGISTTLNNSKYTLWLEYWQALRDLPETYANNPNEIIWPIKPDIN